VNEISIKTFINIVKHGSITKAANAMFLSQSTISQRLKLLEKELNTKLVERSKGGKSINLTSEGKKFMEIAMKWDNLYQETVNLKQKKSFPTVSIGAVDSVNVHILKNVYTKLQDGYSSLNIKIRTDQSTSLYSLLEHKEIDVGFTLKEMSVKNIKVEKFFEEPMVLINKNTNNTLSTNVDLDPKYELYIDWGTDFRIWHEERWGTKNTQNIHIDTSELISIFIDNPHYWAIVPVSVAKSIKKVKPININFLAESPPNRVCYKITSKDSINRNGLEIFEEVLSKNKMNINSTFV